MKLHRNATVLAGILVALALGGVASAAPCGDTAGPGGSDVPCSCGDTVVTTTTLISPSADPVRGDPVVSTVDADVCNGDGLIIAPPSAARMTVNLGGNTIRGAGAGIGITVSGTGVRINLRNGRVRDFATGLTNAGSATGDARITGVTVDHNADGIDLHGNSHELDSNQVLDNTTVGLRVTGNSSRISFNQVSRSGSNGIEVIGDENHVNANRMNRNLGSGMLINGDNNSVDHNTSENNSVDGIAVVGNGDGDPATLEIWKNKTVRNGRTGVAVEGSNHEIVANQGTTNGDDGITIVGTGSRLQTNVARENKRDGIVAAGGGNVDGGGNLGKKNGGVQCQIDGAACIP